MPTTAQKHSLLKLVNDIIWAMEKKQIMMVVILDLLVACETVDHEYTTYNSQQTS